MSAAERDAAVLVEKVARAICRKITGLGADWREYIPPAQIAVFGAENVDVDASNRARGVTPDGARAAVERVRALHFTRGRNILGQPVCNECSPLQPMPCPTLRALDGAS